MKGGQVMAQPKPIFARIENKIEEGSSAKVGAGSGAT